jgi:hypothetical protein
LGPTGDASDAFARRGAYGIIRRCERFGLRIVGSLKPQPALNVLAIYEK